VALAEICIASGVGANVAVNHPFSEDPHRFLAVFEPGTVELADDLARKIGVIGGDQIVINGSAVDVDVAADRWHRAIERALTTV
jgi:hypothetical protein